MKRAARRSVPLTMTVVAVVVLAGAQAQQGQGRPIGKVTTQGDIIVLELDEGVVTPANLFDLDRRTLRFTPAGNSYRVANLPLQWDSGSACSSPAHR